MPEFANSADGTSIAYDRAGSGNTLPYDVDRELDDLAAVIHAGGGSAWWPSMVAIANTLPYDLAITGDGIVPVERLAGIRIPVLALDGGASPAWADAAAKAIKSAVPEGSRRTLEGQNHNVAADHLAPVLIEFFN